LIFFFFIFDSFTKTYLSFKRKSYFCWL